MDSVRRSEGGQIKQEVTSENSGARERAIGSELLRMMNKASVT
jgi:hypothetical protein